LPGWRLGWLIVHDHREVLRKVRQGIANLCQIIAGASPLIQVCMGRAMG
jgi:tyrosine aminotransferase